MSISFFFSEEKQKQKVSSLLPPLAACQVLTKLNDTSFPPKQRHGSVAQKNNNHITTRSQNTNRIVFPT